MLKNFLSAIALMGLWLLLSGLYKPIIVMLGLFSVILVLFIVRRMDDCDGDAIVVELIAHKTFLYFFWLIKEIAKSNWVVTRLILSRKIKICPKFFRVPHRQRCDFARVIFSNSITLTPGTITVEIEKNHLLVHALSYTSRHKNDLSDMDFRVTSIESTAQY